MKLNLSELSRTQEWEKAGFILPAFDIEQMKKNTRINPEWVHFGAGNIFRAFPAAVCQHLLNTGTIKTGIIVAEGYDYEIIKKSYQPHDNLSVAVTLKADGTISKEVIASIAESLTVDTTNSADWNRLEEIFAYKGLKMVSFTITEKGYSLKNGSGVILPDVAADFENGPAGTKSYIGKLASLMYYRYTHGATPLTLVSMDNCSHNGTKLHDALIVFADKWCDNGLTDSEFVDYMKSDVSYPWSMIDKITPRPADSVSDMLKKVGFEDVDSIVTSKNTYVAPFVNAEEPQYLVIQDTFKNGRIPLDRDGIIYTDRETVDKVEKMKVCTCLNPLHTSLAVYGCLLSYEKICDEMKDEQLVNLVDKVGYQEGLPVVINPGIISPTDFINEVIAKRLPNPFMPDTPQRIACDTSQKLGIRFGNTIKAYNEDSLLNAASLTYIPLVIAGWCRYLTGRNDNGDAFELSPDPMLSSLTPLFSLIKTGETTESVHVKTALNTVLTNKAIFGCNLYEMGLGTKIESFFNDLNAADGAIRTTLQRYC